MGFNALVFTVAMRDSQQKSMEIQTKKWITMVGKRALVLAFVQPTGRVGRVYPRKVS